MVTGGLKIKKENVISGLLRGDFWQPLIAPEARKERSCQFFSASHLGPRADCPFHRPAFFRPGFLVCLRAQHLLRTQFCVRDTKMFLILFRNILCPQQGGLEALPMIQRVKVRASFHRCKQNLVQPRPQSSQRVLT